MKLTIRATETTRSVDLALWCREYHQHNSYPCAFDRRFAIGLYQIYQGMLWDGLNRNESFAAAAIHFIITLEAADISPRLPEYLVDLVTKHIDWKTVMLHVSRAQQHVLYGTQLRIKKGTARSTRYCPEQLRDDLSALIEILFAAIPSDQRAQAIWDATSIMTKRL